MTISDPTLQSILVSDLHVDPTVQRNYDPRWARRIADNFDEDKLGVFRVSQRANGLVYILDGQHRFGALQLKSWHKMGAAVQALVYTGLSLAEEAELFVAFNIETRKPNSIDGYRLKLVSGDADIVRIQEVLDKHGLKVEYGGSGNSVAAVAALNKIYADGGPALLDRTLNIVESAWGVTNRDGRDGNLLKGVAYVLQKSGRNLDTDSLIDKLGKSGRPGQILGTARTMKSATKRSLWMEIAHAIVAIYNKGRSSRKVAL